MKRKVLVFLSMSFFILSLIMYGNSDLDNTLMPLDLLRDKMLKAIDPANKLKDVKTRTTVSKLNMPLQDIKAEVTTIFKAPDKLYIKTVLSDGRTAIQAFDGKIGWKSEGGKKPLELTGKELDSFRFSSGLESTQYRWNELFEKIEYDGNKYKVENFLCYKLSCYPKKKYNINTPVIFYVDDKEYFIRKMELTVYSIVGDISQTVFVNGYKSFDSIMVPFKTKTDIFGAELSLTVMECKFGEDINDKLFIFK